MEVIPAIDLRGGQAVRLHQGDYAQQTTFSDDPAGVARGFAAAGASRIHVVDLDGALAGAPANAAVVRAIAAVGTPVELGGGLRSEADVAAALEAGVGRVVIGTAAVREPELVSRLIAAYGPERVVVGLDAREGVVAVSGWTGDSGVRATELMAQMAGRGVVRFIYTDIARDGTLTEPNYAEQAQMVAHAGSLGPGVRVIASGGIATVDHLVRLAGLGVEGAIVGSAIYRGTVDLAEALEAVARA